MNIERKLEFLKYKQETTEFANNAKVWFRDAEYFEDRYGKDVCDWTSAEIIAFEKYLSTSKIKTLTLLTNTMKIYTDWCIVNSLVIDNQNHWSEISTSVLCECIDIRKLCTSYISKEQLYDALTLLHNSSDKFILLGLFEGLTISELAVAKPSDIHNGYFYGIKRELKISQDLIDIISETVTETTYTGYKQNSIECYLIPGDEIIRPIDYRTNNVKENSKTLIGARYRSIIKYVGINNNVTMLSMRESGRINMIMEICKRNNISIQKCLTHQYRVDIEKRYGVIQNCTVYGNLFTRIVTEMKGI